MKKNTALRNQGGMIPNPPSDAFGCQGRRQASTVECYYGVPSVTRQKAGKVDNRNCMPSWVELKNREAKIGSVKINSAFTEI